MRWKPSLLEKGVLHGQVDLELDRFLLRSGSGSLPLFPFVPTASSSSFACSNFWYCSASIGAKGLPASSTSLIACYSHRPPKTLAVTDLPHFKRMPQDVVQPAKSRWDFLRIVKEMNQSVNNDWGGSRPPVNEDDAEFLQHKERLLDLEKQLTSASKQAESFVKAQQDIAETMGDFGLSFMKLTKYENQQAFLETQRKRAADMKNLATSAIKATRLWRELNSQTDKHLDTLHDQMGLILGVHTAFSDRSSTLLTVQTLTTELDSLYSQAEKLESASSRTFGSDRSKTLKL
ncbi:hypothetical protein L2E82_18800 [Cichorium intybus]|uniref:Uncharacterized protein n=1 Tax=Cichorium intybus TaxID=13427 RepID=A0ACB9FB36_CICIN|nr:hypothetical protein L2E82_18800 [Cichorium intybus]